MAMVDDSAIELLPAPVQRSLRRSGIVGTEIPASVVVRQDGQIRTNEDARWLRFKAVQEYSLDPPGFVWKAALKIGGLTVGKATDTLADGHGHVRVKLLGVFDVVDQSGPELDQGTLLRWLNETMWFPAVWATDAIRWQPVDGTSAIGSITIGDLTVQAEFVFDDVGRFVDFRADRYYADGTEFVLRPWSTPIDSHASFGGLELPASGHGVWALPDGDFEYVQIRATDISYTT
jgi:hypothetical protein